MAFAHLPCYDVMEKVGQEVEAIRTHNIQVRELRRATLHYHYHRFSLYYFTSPWRPREITTFKDNYKQVVEQIGRNSQYATTGLGSEVEPNSGWRFKKIKVRSPTAPLEAELNSRTYKMPNGMNIITDDGKCLDRWGNPFVPIA